MLDSSFGSVILFSRGFNVAVQYANWPNQPRNVSLRDPGVSGWADVFSWAFILSSVAAAGLAVSLLTQSVGEAVISGTKRHSDIETWIEREWVTEKPTGKKREISISVDLSYLHRSSMTVFDISFLRVSTTPSLPQGPESQMSHIPGPLSILVVYRCGYTSVSVRCVTG